MKLKLAKNAEMVTKKNEISALNRFIQLIGSFSQIKRTDGSDFVKNGIDVEKHTDEINLYVDIIGDMDNEFSDKSDKLKLVIYTGDSSQFSESSVPCIVFSLSSLIDEKIELLDAALATQKNIVNLERLAIQLSHHSSLLRDALKRNRINSGRFSNKNSPLW